MSILAALTSYYDRMAERGEVPPFGYSMEKIGFRIDLKPDGTVDGLPQDLRNGTGKKLSPMPLAVPQPEKRTSGISPNFLWDKTSYVLGVTAGEGKRTAEEHKAFVKYHNEALEQSGDEGLAALHRFLAEWKPEKFEELGWPEEMKDQNVVFRLVGERKFVHERSAAQKAWSQIQSSAEGSEKSVCLISGEKDSIARLHPAIKGVWGAQSSGASIVSFNLDAFTSFGHEQGDNAPVSEQAAFAYTTVLNALLAKGSKNRIQVGDASTVFWADASNAADAETAESFFATVFGGAELDESQQAGAVGDLLKKISVGRPLDEIKPDLPSGVRFFVLGLAPNAARLSIRFWIEDDFAQLAERYVRYSQDLHIEPVPQQGPPSLWRFLIETAVQRKSENIPPLLAGELMRAILAGTPYPRSLLALLLTRLRADKHMNGHRVALIKAVLTRNFNLKRKPPVSLDLENRDAGYLLGRLFAVYEQIQSAALGPHVNATIKDKFYSSASATPRRVFNVLARNAAPHLSKLSKQRKGQAVNLEKLLASILDLMDPKDDPFPAYLPVAQQGLFALGYYHQRSAFFTKSHVDEIDDKSEVETTE